MERTLAGQGRHRRQPSHLSASLRWPTVVHLRNHHRHQQQKVPPANVAGGGHGARERRLLPCFRIRAKAAEEGGSKKQGI